MQRIMTWSVSLLTQIVLKNSSVGQMSIMPLSENRKDEHLEIHWSSYQLLYILNYSSTPSYFPIECGPFLLFLCHLLAETGSAISAGNFSPSRILPYERTFLMNVPVLPNAPDPTAGVAQSLPWSTPAKGEGREEEKKPSVFLADVWWDKLV